MNERNDANQKIKELIKGHVEKVLVVQKDHLEERDKII